MTLYELKDEWLGLLDLIEAGADEDVVKDTLESLDYEIEQKADGYAKIIKQLELDVEGFKLEIARMQERKRVLENHISNLKGNLKDAMELTGKTKFKTELFSFGIANNPPKVVIDDPTGIPKEYLIAQEPKVDTKAIKEYLDTVEGESKFAHLEQGRSLRIR